MSKLTLVLTLMLTLTQVRAQEKAEEPAPPAHPGMIAEMPEFTDAEPEKTEMFERRDEQGNLIMQYRYYTDDFGRRVKHGSYTEWYPGTTQKKRESEYRHGRMHGQQRWWHSNGAIWQQFSCVMGQREGNLMEYRRNGRLMRQARYVGGKMVENRPIAPTGQE